MKAIGYLAGTALLVAAIIDTGWPSIIVIAICLMILLGVFYRIGFFEEEE